MKTIPYLVKTVILLFTFLSYGYLPSQGSSLSGNTPKSKAKMEKKKEQITAFFSDYLSGKTQTYAETSALRLPDIESNRDLVW